MNAGVSSSGRLDPLTFSVLAGQFESACSQMTNTMLRTSRSSILSMARDFACAIVTAQGELVVSVAGQPVHVSGPNHLASAMTSLHCDLAEGDAFLHNDVYLGATHAADHAVLVPVFYEGRHVFTTVALGHQADIGNALPTTYMPHARDVYEEGAVVFPCVRVQQSYEDVDDIVRMAKSRIRDPETWYGDYLAALGAARVGEIALGRLLAKYGVETTRRFVQQLFDASESAMRQSLQALEAGEWEGRTRHDPLPGAPEGLELAVRMVVDADRGQVVIDLTDNPDCLPSGMNQSQTCAINTAIVGVFNCLPEQPRLNAGSLRCFDVRLRENCVAGIPRHPASCSMATTNVSDRIINLVQEVISDMGDGRGMAHGAVGMGAERAVIAGAATEEAGRRYQTQLFIGTQGGPGTPWVDGWSTYVLPVAAGMLLRDSVEVSEQKYPIIVWEVGIEPDCEGAGWRRGGPGNVVVYGPRSGTMDIFFTMDGVRNPPKGVAGGLGATGPSVAIRRRDGTFDRLDHGETTAAVAQGERVVAVGGGGGGYGNPHRRDPALVLHDVMEGLVTPHRAHAVYGVVLVGDPAEPESLAVDPEGTTLARSTSSLPTI